MSLAHMATEVIAQKTQLLAVTGPGANIRTYLQDQVMEIAIGIIIVFAIGFLWQRKIMDLVWFIVLAGIILFIVGTPDVFKTTIVGYIKSAIGVS